MDFNFGFKKQSDVRLQFYTDHPTEVFKLYNIEELALERLKVLRFIETVGQEYVKGSKEYHEQLITKLFKCNQMGKSFTYDSDMDPTKSIKTDIKNDQLSHFILTLAYCRTEELSRWFLQQEMDLFRFRFTIESNHCPQTIEKFMTTNNIMLIRVSEDEKKRLLLPNEITIYKVPFVDVPDLIEKSKIFANRGFTYLKTAMDISSVVITQLRMHMSRMLATFRSNIDTIDEDIRLRSLLTTLPKRYIGKQYDGKVDETITAAQIPLLAKQSFPPCMEQIQVALMRDNHLKHAARMQYGLFLKGIGLSLDEALKFWSGAFQPRVDADKFAKQYAYNIRHNYGQEGKRVSYTPYSCMKIITASGINECCGCPFQKMDSELMEQRLKSNMKATPQQIESIVDKMNQNQYQVSCKNYFNLVHGLPSDNAISISHPNQYFEESQKVLNNKPKSSA